MFKEINLAKSLRVAMAEYGEKGIKTSEIAANSTLTAPTINLLRKLTPGNSANTNTLVEICKVLDMPVSEFIAIGEE